MLRISITTKIPCPLLGKSIPPRQQCYAQFSGGRNIICMFVCINPIALLGYADRHHPGPQPGSCHSTPGAVSHGRGGVHRRPKPRSALRIVDGWDDFPRRRHRPRPRGQPSRIPGGEVFLNSCTHQQPCIICMLDRVDTVAARIVCADNCRPTRCYIGVQPRFCY